MTISLHEDHLRHLLQLVWDLRSGDSFEERWQGISAGLQSVIPHHAIVVTTIQPSTVEVVSGPLQKGLVYLADPLRQAHYITRVSPTEQRDYLDHYSGHDPSAPVSLQAAGRVVRMSDVIGSSHWGRDAATADFFPQLGVKHGLGCMPRLSERVLFTFALYRDVGRPDFSDDEKLLLGLLVPHLTEAARGSLLTEAIHDSFSADSATQGGFLVIETNTLEVVSSTAARALLDAADTTTSIGDILSAGVRALKTRPELRVSLPCRDGPGWIGLHFLTLPGGHQVCVAVTTLEPGSQDHFDAAADAARLSPREREVAMHAMNGLANKEIARELGIRPDTVKQYLSSAYRKTGTVNRAALVRYLLGRRPGP